MKLFTLIALFILNAQAQFRATIDYVDPKLADQSIEQDTMEKLDKRLLKFLRHPSKRPHVTWDENKEGSIACKLETDMEGNSKELCAHSESFTVSIEDITAEVAEKKAKKKKHDDLLEKLKTQDLTPKELNELLRERLL